MDECIKAVEAYAQYVLGTGATVRRGATFNIDPSDSNHAYYLNDAEGHLRVSGYGATAEEAIISLAFHLGERFGMGIPTESKRTNV